MASLITARTPVEAWVSAGSYILANGPVFNLIAEIGNPLDFDLHALRSLDGERESHGAESVSNVINTIFPRKTWINSDGDRTKFYDRYAHIFNVLRKRDPSSWGTYFARMTAFGKDRHNQLEEIITKLNGWKNNPQAALYLHISSRDLDSPRPLRAPCLQYVEFLCPTRDSISLCAVYRNHDFFNKALGNYLGLALLLAYVGEATKRKVDTLTCHSAHAYFDGTKENFDKLISVHK